MRRLIFLIAMIAAIPLRAAEEAPRLVMFVGVDVSGSFLRGKDFNDSLEFLARYLHAHLNGTDGTEKPSHLFVGALGGEKEGEAKTFHPIESFDGKDVEQIHKKLAEIFPQKRSNRFTDYNAFFEQIATSVRNRKLVLKPMSVVVISDGKPDLPGEKGIEEFRKIDVSPLERLSRNVTLRVLYTDAVTGQNWQTKVPRKRVKIWTQDASVMKEWKEIPNQEKFMAWMKSNVDFGVAARRVE